MGRFVFCCFIWHVAACWAIARASAEPLVISGPTMGTTYHVKLVDVPPGDEPALRAKIAAVLDDVDRRMSTYRQDSEICHFNRAPAGEWFAVSPATAEIVSASLAVSRQTGGALDITVGPLVRLWHFGPEALAETRSASDIVPPSDDAIEKARASVGYEKLLVRTDLPALRKQASGLEIDLSAIGEGYAIDRLTEVLAKIGVENFLVELGGEIRVVGRGPGGRPWRVAVERPRAEQSEMVTTVELSNAALATSGDYRRYFDHDGSRYSHVINPATGRPIRHSLASVTVVADDALTADAWDTAILVLGPDRGYDCAVRHGIAALLISRQGERFMTQETPAWRKRFPTATNSGIAEERRQWP